MVTLIGFTIAVVRPKRAWVNQIRYSLSRIPIDVHEVIAIGQSVIVDELDARRGKYSRNKKTARRRARRRSLAMRQSRGSPTNRRDCKFSRDQIASGYIINPTWQDIVALPPLESKREREELCITTFCRSILWVRTAYFYEIRLKGSFPILPYFCKYRIVVKAGK